MANKLIVSAAPHITSSDSTSKIMQRVCLALVPTLIASVLVFGISSLILTVVTVAACVLFEYGYCKMMGREIAIDDFSAVVTGMLLAFNLPAGMPVWMAVVGAFIMGILNNGMSLYGWSTDVQKIVKGAVLLGAVTVDLLSKRKKG